MVQRIAIALMLGWLVWMGVQATPWRQADIAVADDGGGDE